MICYRDRSYCADQDHCAVPYEECSRRLTDADNERSIAIGLPIAWMSFKDTCGKFKDISK